jgi:TRAP-type C4-dicarboxylate transport system permease small subunit
MMDASPQFERTGLATRGLLLRLTALIAIAGGLLALAVAALVTLSVIGRWLYNAPIDGDFEFVKMATAVGVFAFLPFTQARGANIVVDTFTLRLPGGVNAAIDAFWSLAYGLFMGFVAYALATGTLEAFRNGETTMQRQLPLWPSIAVSAALAGLLALTALAVARALTRAKPAEKA